MSDTRKYSSHCRSIDCVGHFASVAKFTPRQNISLRLAEIEKASVFCWAWQIGKLQRFCTKDCLSYLENKLKTSDVAKTSNHSPTHLTKLGARDQRWCHPEANLHELNINFHKAWSIKHFSSNISHSFAISHPKSITSSKKLVYVMFGGRGQRGWGVG